jgi:glycosyltransferase involved in cell wall biosynthesis
VVVDDASPRRFQSLNSMPSLLVIAPSAYPLGGVAEWLDYLLPALRPLGWNCVLGLVSGRHHDVPAYVRRHPGHNVLPIANRSGSPQGRLNAITQAMRQVRPDLLLCVNIEAAYAAIRNLRARGEAAPKLAMALHGLQSELLSEIELESDVIDAVVAPNGLAVNLAVQRIGTRNRVFYASCGTSVLSSSVRSGTAHSPLKLFFSGRLDQDQKRVQDLVKLAQILQERAVPFELAIAGDGPERGALLEMIASRPGIAKSIRLLGALTSGEARAEYRNHDALIITSEWETGPLVAWEAMSEGLPVISSRYVGSGLEAALEDGRNCLLFPVGDMQAAADAVLRVAQPQLRERLVHEGFELVRARYTHPHSVELWDAALKRILQLPSLPVPAKTSRHPAGRLDSWLGPRWGERVRRAIRRPYLHATPGDEWPHTGQAMEAQHAFLARAAAMDRQHG